MKIKVGQNIKELRQKNGITQDKMAEYLGITAQAISRWENEDCYPDIEILTAISSFFGVTTDELLGVDVARNDEKVANIIDEVQVLWSDGLLDKCISILRAALNDYPNNYKLLQYLMMMLYQRSGENKNENRKEAAAIGERILSDCKDERIRQSCIMHLAFIYKALGENEKAVNMASKLPNVNCCSNVVMPRVIDIDKQVLEEQKNLQLFSEYVGSKIAIIADIDFINKNVLTVEQKLFLLDKINKFYEILYENGDYGFYSARLSDNYRKMAAGYLLIKDYENALQCLEKATEHAIVKDTLPEKYEHTSLLFNKVIFEKKKDSNKNFSQSLSYVLLNNYLKAQERYNPIRDTERFKAIIAKLEEYSK